MVACLSPFRAVRDTLKASAGGLIAAIQAACFKMTMFIQPFHGDGGKQPQSLAISFPPQLGSCPVSKFIGTNKNADTDQRRAFQCDTFAYKTVNEVWNLCQCSPQKLRAVLIILGVELVPTTIGRPSTFNSRRP